MKTTKIPVYGNISRPTNPEEGLEELKAGAISWSEGDINIEYSSGEFTSVCPSTGQPDFNDVVISYKPDKLYIESKCLKFYLWSFREYGIHCEKLACKIARDISGAIECKEITVLVKQRPRGGIGLSAIKKIIKEYESINSI
ncbi:COG0780 Enzyme related to GTP cyclohydrolase I [uncultured Caudovirales phage]|uniref:COG0780 Enzyme related to GTP cyclohydrolase I n=1 Tax=uncultured Caudovirales phage TaxID=2100421 RepID=A0A6J5LNJ8_9CAUD|nr:COG0780 Enzyme related to GTP cyclohydrolase I [uncultured Caudovirales phage]